MPILSTSQTISDSIKISSEQLRVTNLIFAEHAKLSSEVPLLEAQIQNLERVDSLWVQTDSARREQIKQYESVVEQKESKIKKVKKWSTFKDYVIGGLSIVIVCLLL